MGFGEDSSDDEHDHFDHLDGAMHAAGVRLTATSAPRRAAASELGHHYGGPVAFRAVTDFGQDALQPGGEESASFARRRPYHHQAAKGHLVTPFYQHTSAHAQVRPQSNRTFDNASDMRRKMFLGNDAAYDESMDSSSEFYERRPVTARPALGARSYSAPHSAAAAAVGPRIVDVRAAVDLYGDAQDHGAYNDGFSRYYGARSRGQSLADL